jgi:heptaprenyl diphosphate synthase
MDKFWNGYPEVKAELNEVVKIMKKNVKCREKVVEEALLSLIESGGKLLRPAFVILSSKFGKNDSKNVAALAASLEMIHMATLIHDDIIDDAKLRRGKNTIQHKYGKNFAVYIGDFLFCVCFKLLSNTSSMKNISIDTHSMSRICIGEIEQYSSKFNYNISVRQYLKRISAKTAELFALSFYTGAAETGCSRMLTAKLASIGHNLGMAFQIIDDVLDYTGDDVTVGKTTSNDIKQGIFTLPIIYALESGNTELKTLLSREDFSEDDIKKIITITKESGALDKTKALGRRYTEKAFNKIKSLPDNPSKITLMSVSEKLLTRKY